MRLVQQVTDYSWRVASLSEAGRSHMVWRDGKGQYRCTCPQHQYRKQKCHHIVAVEQGISQGEITLVIRRKPGESVQIGPHIRVRFIGMHDGQAVLAFQAPPDVVILRGEVARLLEAGDASGSNWKREGGL